MKYSDIAFIEVIDHEDARRILPHLQQRWILYYVQWGYSSEDIAEEFGVAASTVRWVLRKNKVNTRHNDYRNKSIKGRFFQVLSKL